MTAENKAALIAKLEAKRDELLRELAHHNNKVAELRIMSSEGQSAIIDKSTYMSRIYALNDLIGVIKESDLS